MFKNSKILRLGLFLLVMSLMIISVVYAAQENIIGTDIILVKDHTSTVIASAETDVLTIGSGNFTAGEEYLLVARSVQDQGDTTAQVQKRIRHGGTAFPSTQEIVDNGGTDGDYAPYFTFVNWTAVEGEDVALSIDPSGANTEYDDAYLMAIHIENVFGTKDTDWWMDINNTGITSIDGTYANNLGAKITFTPDGTSDYLVLSSSLIVKDGGCLSGTELFNGSNQLMESQRNTDNNNDVNLPSMMTVLQQPASEEITLQLRYRCQTVQLDDLNDSRLFMARLGRFKDVATDYDNGTLKSGETGLSNYNATTTVDHTMSTAGKALLFGGHIHADVDRFQYHNDTDLILQKTIDQTLGNDGHFFGVIDYFDVDTATRSYNLSISANSPSPDWWATSMAIFSQEITDVVSPGFSNLQNNASTVSTNQSIVKWNVTVQEETGLNNVIWSTVNVSAADGVWVNESSESASGTSHLTNLTKTIGIKKDTLVCAKIYANDTSGNINESQTSCFTVANTAPGQVASWTFPPINNSINNTNMDFNWSDVNDSDADTLFYHLFINLSGPDFELVYNGTLSNWTSNFTTESDYMFKVGVFDGNEYGENSSTQIFTFDDVDPNVNISDITTTAGSQTVSFDINVTDSRILSCKYSIFDSTGSIDGLNENISVGCTDTDTEATVSEFATYNLTVYGLDTAGNENSGTQSFTTSEAAAGGSTGGGGGGGGTPSITLVENSIFASKWRIGTLQNSQEMNVLLSKDSVRPRKKTILIVNEGTQRLEMDIFCSESNVTQVRKSSDEIALCDFVTFSQDRVVIEANDQKGVELTMFVMTPPDSRFGDKYFFNVFALSEVNQSNETVQNEISKLSVSAPVSIFGVFFKWSEIPVQKLEPDKDPIQYPAVAPSLVISALLFTGIALVMMRKLKLVVPGFFTSLVTSVGAFVGLILIL